MHRPLIFALAAAAALSTAACAYNETLGRNQFLLPIDQIALTLNLPVRPVFDPDTLD